MQKKIYKNLLIKCFQDILYKKIIFKNYKFGVPFCFSLKQKIHAIILLFINYKYLMKYLILSKRSRALIGIGIVAISIGLISKKKLIIQLEVV